MSRQPTVSVIVPTYNQAPFVEAAVRSVLAQTYPACEIVVADDGSSDETPAIIRSLAAEYPGKIRPLLSTHNTGVSRNVNRGLAAASGAYVAFLAGDDLTCRLSAPSSATSPFFACCDRCGGRHYRRGRRWRGGDERPESL